MSVTRDEAMAGGMKPPADAPGAGDAVMVKVWDPLVRLFHWSLVAAFSITWLTGEEMGWLHARAGYAIMALLAIRVTWGLFSAGHARFSDFVYRPSTVLAHLVDTLRMRTRRYLGHNPAGGAMIVLLLAMLAVTAGTGYMLTTDAFWGVRWVRELHQAIATATLVFVGLHVLGVIVASFEHRENLVRAMITGKKRASH